MVAEFSEFVDDSVKKKNKTKQRGIDNNSNPLFSDPLSGEQQARYQGALLSSRYERSSINNSVIGAEPNES